jgi:hypothetical protein
MTETAWVVRVADESDRKLLKRFSCADPKVRWSLEVQEEIRWRLLDWAKEGAATEYDSRVLLVFDRASQKLVGVAAHERVFLGTTEADKIAATKLHLVGVAKAWQGKSFSTRERVSRVVMNAMMTDIAARVPSRDARLYAIVHEDNVRSLALCKRFGLVHEIERLDPHYVRLVTASR